MKLLDEGDGVADLHKFLVLRIPDRIRIIASHFAKYEVNSNYCDFTV